MNDMTQPAPKPDGLEAMRVPFPDAFISKLPKGTKAQNECAPAEKVNCRICGGWHHPKVVHLDYVGHAAITQRLLDADPHWSWEPLAYGPDGLPKLDDFGGMWIRLTVAGHTRLGYGDAAGKHGTNAIKEVIGDALRNAAMRFGAALELWHKGDWEVDTLPPQPDDNDPAKDDKKPVLPPYSDDSIDANLDAWKGVVKSGRKTADSLIATLKTRAVLSAAQEKKIRDGLTEQAPIDAEFVEQMEGAE